MKLRTYLLEQSRNWSASPILPLGIVNLMTGKSKYFNIYDTWDGENTTCEFWKDPNNKMRLIFTAGKKPIYSNGTHKDFVHDQTRARLFTATKVDDCLMKDLSSRQDQYGKSLTGYTYK